MILAELFALKNVVFSGASILRYRLFYPQRGASELLEFRIRQGVRVNVAIEEESPGPDPFPLLTIIWIGSRVHTCIRDKTLTYQERTFRYCQPAVMYDHFDEKHAQLPGGMQDISCNRPKCNAEAVTWVE
ncbi:hypothetical protein QBC43DRAFT_271257 [Cladorrhinum sp. PSN259]|nr:hypothetical protein QBC43DRAFT_271257 [Cladorrhinum sp. PSN259]